MAQTILDSGVAQRSGYAKRLSWGAIFAGVVVVLITQLMLYLLGLAFGSGSIDPLEEKNPLSGLGLGSAIWLGISTLIALFAGGWVSARLAAMPDRTESTLHGIVTWGFSSLAVAYLITVAVSGVLSGAAGVIGKTASVLGQGVKAVAPEIAQAVGNEFGDNGLSWDAVKKEAESLLRQTKAPALQPNAIEQQANRATKDAKSTASDIAKAPQSADNELSSLWNRIEARGERVIEAADQEALVNVLVARTNMTRAAATATVERWQQTLNDAKVKLAELKANAEQRAREVADSTAGAVSKAATWTFVGLLLGLFAAAAGGFLGCPNKGTAFGFRPRSIVEQESAA